MSTNFHHRKQLQKILGVGLLSYQDFNGMVELISSVRSEEKLVWLTLSLAQGLEMEGGGQLLPKEEKLQNCHFFNILCALS